MAGRKKTPAKAEAELYPKLPSEINDFRLETVKRSFLKEAGPVAAVIATISTGHFYAIANHADPKWSTVGAVILILAFYADPLLRKLAR